MLCNFCDCDTIYTKTVPMHICEVQQKKHRHDHRASPAPSKDFAAQGEGK